MIGVSVTFQYDEDFDRARVLSTAENARQTFEGMTGLRSKVFTVDDTGRRAMNFYVWQVAPTMSEAPGAPTRRNLRGQHLG